MQNLSVCFADTSPSRRGKLGSPTRGAVAKGDGEVIH